LEERKLAGRRLPRVRPLLCDEIVDLNLHGRSGVLLLGLKGADSGSYTDSSYKNDVLLGARIHNVSGYDEIRKVFPEGINISQSHNGSGYLNRDGGWVNAGKGVELIAKKVQSMGGNLLLGKTASKLIMKEGRAEGVLCEDGSLIDADFIIIALGSWTASALPELNLSQYCVATGYMIPCFWSIHSSLTCTFSSGNALQ
jgi:sarcosine oxidase / L-pipecolate oxidase